MKLTGIEISNHDKIWFPKKNITKGQVVEYYYSIADKILPYLKDRPLSLERYPDGIAKDGFYQKRAPEYFPSFVKTVKIKTEDDEIEQVVCNTRKTLIYLVNQGTLCFHTWQSRIDKIDKPDKVIFDLDPSTHSFKKVKDVASIIGEYLTKKNIKSNLMTTGKSGLHVWYKIRRTKTFNTVHEEVKAMAKEIEQKHPKLCTTEMRKNKRSDKIFIDYLRNSYGQTSVCPYALRPNQSAGIAMPIEWKKLSSLKSSTTFTLDN